jgi:hypothetical protein
MADFVLPLVSYSSAGDSSEERSLCRKTALANNSRTFSTLCVKNREAKQAKKRKKDKKKKKVRTASKCRSGPYNGSDIIEAEKD